MKKPTKKTIDQLAIFLSKKEFYFYPAQYWSHKNHAYILYKNIKRKI